MQTTSRPYDRVRDYERVGRFLVKTCRTGRGHVNWLQPRWEYMHYHPYIRRVDLSSIGVWESRGEIVGVVHPEHSAGTVYLQLDPAHDALAGAMLRYAEDALYLDRAGARRLRVYINDSDDDLLRVAKEMGFARSEAREPMSRLVIPAPFPPVTLPGGFRLRSLADGNDLREVDRVLWRGFNHGDEPPDDGVEDREFMQSAPNFRKDLNIVVEAPDGHFVAYCGMWFEPVHRIAYVEPVATDPDYRRMGLGRSAVLEGIRRCGELGATVAWVGTDMPFYLSFGFEPIYQSTAWRREWA